MDVNDLFEAAKRLPGYSPTNQLADDIERARTHIMSVKEVMSAKGHGPETKELARIQGDALELVGIGLQMIPRLAPYSARFTILPVFVSWTKLDHYFGSNLRRACDDALRDLDRLAEAAQAWKAREYDNESRGVVQGAAVSALKRFVDLAGKLELHRDQFLEWAERQASAPAAA